MSLISHAQNLTTSADPLRLRYTQRMQAAYSTEIRWVVQGQDYSEAPAQRDAADVNEKRAEKVGQTVFGYYAGKVNSAGVPQLVEYNQSMQNPQDDTWGLLLRTTMRTISLNDVPRGVLPVEIANQAADPGLQNEIAWVQRLASLNTDSHKAANKKSKAMSRARRKERRDAGS